MRVKSSRARSPSSNGTKIKGDVGPRAQQPRDTLALIYARQKELSRNHRRVARYVLAHLDEAAFLTAAKLAQRCNSSEATAIRFAKGLGFRGFPDFQQEMRTALRQKLSPGQKLNSAEPIPAEIEELVTETEKRSHANLGRTRELLSASNLKAVADAIITADQKYVVGLRASAGSARTFGFYLGQIQPGVSVLTEGGSLSPETLLSMNKKDILITFSFPRYTKGTIEALYWARERGVRTVTVTDSPLGPPAQLTELTLLAQADAFFTNSYVATSFIIDTIIAAVLVLAPQPARDRLAAVEAMFRSDFFEGV